jgi:hypothetical protein
MGAGSAIGYSCLFVSLVHLSLELILPVFFGRNYTPVFSQKFPYCWSARCVNCSCACMLIGAGRAGPPHLFSSQFVSMQANLRCTFQSARSLLLHGFQVWVIWVLGNFRCFLSGCQQEVGVPIQDWQRGVGSFVLFRLSFRRLSLRATTGELPLDWYLMKDVYPL